MLDNPHIAGISLMLLLQNRIVSRKMGIFPLAPGARWDAGYASKINRAGLTMRDQVIAVTLV